MHDYGYYAVGYVLVVSRVFVVDLGVLTLVPSDDGVTVLHDVVTVATDLLEFFGLFPFTLVFCLRIVKKLLISFTVI